MKSHVIISGTGRTGTSFLVNLLTRLGLDTGFNNVNGYHINCRAGFEKEFKEKNLPYIIKNPYFCDYAEDIIRDKSMIIDHVYIPMRDIDAAVASRQFVVDSSQDTHGHLPPSKIPGGLWGTDKKNEQKNILLNHFYKLLLALSKESIPVTILNYPKLVKDVKYLYSKLQFLVKEIEYRKFKTVFEETVNPNWVHSFNEKDVCSSTKIYL